MRIGRRGATSSLVLLGIGLLAYDTQLRWWMRDWGSTPDERRMSLPGDDIVEDLMSHHTKAVTVQAPSHAVWPWVAQIGDRRAGFYSYDWVERATGGVHYVDGRHSATVIHPELQDVKVGDRLDTASYGRSFRVGAQLTVVEPGHALVAGTWAFILEPGPDGTTRFLVRERYPGWIRLVVPRRLGMLRAIGAAVDYLFGEPLHFVMERRMMLGVKQRAETSRPAMAQDGIGILQPAATG